ncbi:MAG: hypothetical protein FGM37_06585 [Phycisphaerales bacterium]|nr:hypothetical protein [Phycisphaerales bacterium]
MARAVRAGLWTAIAAAGLCACESARPVPQPDGPAPDAAAVADAQRARLSAIPTLAMRGVAELRWSDESGAHMEDGDFELVLRAPLDTSLRVTKFGERVMWAGSGGGRWWLFEPKAQPSRVTVGTVDVTGDGDGSGLIGLMRPARLLATIGLRPIEASQVQSIEWDSGAGCWRALVRQGSGMMSVELRHASLLPVAVEWLDREGKVQLRSELSSFAWPGAEEAVTRPGALVPTRIAISMFEPAADASLVRDGRAPAAQATLALVASAPTDGAARIRDRLFEFESLRAALKPEVVSDVAAGGGNAIPAPSPEGSAP